MLISTNSWIINSSSHFLLTYCPIFVNLYALYIFAIKHSKKFPCVFGGWLIFMNTPPGIEGGYCIYFLRVRDLTQNRSYAYKALPLSRSAHKNPPSLHLLMYMCLGSLLWSSDVYNGESPHVGGIPRVKAQNWLSPCPRPLIWGLPWPWGFTLHSAWIAVTRCHNSPTDFMTSPQWWVFIRIY